MYIIIGPYDELFPGLSLIDSQAQILNTVLRYGWVESMFYGEIRIRTDYYCVI